MADFYGNENFPLPVVELLRAMGHDVLTSLEAGNANCGVPDEEVLKFAREKKRVLLTVNRYDFKCLHMGKVAHEGILACSQDTDFERQAKKIHQTVKAEAPLAGKYLNILRPPR